MYFEQFYLACLSHASYMIGSEGVAAVVDPQRDVGIYLEEARKTGLKISHVIETHLHADFVSGHRELAERTGARIYLGARAGARFPHVAVQEGDTISFGRCVLRVLETPGHTLESMCVLVTDLDRSPDPIAVLTGDTLFIGDVGRPDLSPDHTPQQLAGMLFDSLHEKLLTLPDHVEVYPAHGAGSLCGRQMSTERKSTIGLQRAANYALQPKTKEEFVTLLTAELPERPGYFALDVEINREGAPPLKELPLIPGLLPAQVHDWQQRGVLVLDTRPGAQFGAGHIPGSIQIGLTGQYASWAATLLGLDRKFIVVAEEEDKLEESAMRLARVGIEGVIGHAEGGIEAWDRAGYPVATVPQLSVQDLDRWRGDSGTQVLDVRTPGEWDAGHVPGAVHRQLNELARGIEGVDRASPVAVMCKSGYRSSIGTSLLKRAGFPEVFNVVGGFDAWKACGLPTTAPAR
ncbi:MAG: MBL fold metallo-hydrolase [Bryobacteraceae bacterium]